MRTVINQQYALTLFTTGEINTEPSLTIPDQHLSIEDLIKRSSVGTLVNSPRTPIFNDDIVVRDARFLDPTDLHEIRNEVLARRDAHQANLNAEKKAQVEANIALLKENARLAKDALKADDKKTDKSPEVPSVD